VRFEGVTEASQLAVGDRPVAVALHPEDVAWAPEAWEFVVMRFEADGAPTVRFTVPMDPGVEVERARLDGELLAYTLRRTDGHWAIDHGGPAIEDEELFDLFLVRR
jgi:streptogramin lyase